MLGKWKIVEKLTDKQYHVMCESCGHTTQRLVNKLKTLHRCPSIIDGTKYCYKCQTRKQLEFFHKDSTVSGGYSKVCKECYAERVGVVNYGYKPVNRRTIKKSRTMVRSTKKDGLEVFLNKRQQSLKHRHKNKNMLEYNLPEGYLLELYKKQNGKCYYSGLQLDYKSPKLSPFSISVDKLDPQNGYTVGNLVLCTHSMNSMKLNMTLGEFKEYLVSINDYIKWFINDEN